LKVHTLGKPQFQLMVMDSSKLLNLGSWSSLA